MIIKTKGDLLKIARENQNIDVIVHGCNCFKTMNSGIAKQIRAEYPQACGADTQYSTKGEKAKLGTYSKCDSGDGFEIINGYTQYRYGTDKMHVDYDAIRTLFRTLNSEYKGKVIAFPKIGAGLAGGNWNIIIDIINTELTDAKGIYVEYNG